MNKKADKATIQFPFNLNLIDNRPQVDNTFKNADKLNAPCLNDMISPIYTAKKEYKAVYDKDGNEYRLVDGNLLRNSDIIISGIDSSKFTRREITDARKYDYYDISDDYIAAGFINDNNTITVAFNGNEWTSPVLFAEGTIVTGRIRIIDDEVILVVYYDVNNTGYVFYARINNEGTTVVADNSARNWRRMRVRTNLSSSIDTWFNTSYAWFDVKQYNPIINICKCGGYIAFSLVSRYGYAYDTLGTHFITVFDDNGTLKEVGSNLLPSSSSQTQVVTYNQQFYAYVTQNTTRTNGSTAIVKITGTNTYVTYDSFTQTETAVPVDVPPEVVPAATGETVNAYDDPQTTGDVYTVDTYNVTRKVQLKCSDDALSWKCDFTYTDPDTLQSVTLSTSTDTTTTKSVQWVKMYYSWEAIPTVNYDTAKIVYTAADNTTQNYTIIRTDFVKQVLVTYTYSQSATVSWVTAPNVVLDNGNMYSLAMFDVNTTSWTYGCPQGSVFVESAKDPVITGSSYTWTVLESAQANGTTWIVRSNSVVLNQNFIETTWKLCNSSATVPSSRISGSESTAARYNEWVNSNAIPLTYSPGTSRDSSFNYYGQAVSTVSVNTGADEDLAVFTVGGFRVPLGNTNFNLLYNTSISGSSYIQGISYSEDDDMMGTLLTPWQSLDEDFYVVANSDTVVYRDKDNKYWEIKIEDGNDIFTILDNRYIIINTTSYWNCYDSKLNMVLHYATDYNDRVVFGSTNNITYWAAQDGSGALNYIRNTATAINAGYAIMPRIGITSPIYPSVARYRTNVNTSAYNCRITGKVNQGIDVYYSEVSGSEIPYRYTINPYLTESDYEKFNLIGSTYTVSDTTYFNPCIFTEFVYGQGNKDLAKETYTYYTLEYVNNQPVLVYSANSETDDTSSFFVLQGQFYGVINDKICSIIYNNGAISEVDPIIDVRGMEFIGNNPSIAFFWDKARRVIKSFTGDADLADIWGASKLVLEDFHYKHYYDTMTQTIFVPSDKGLFAIAPKSLFLIEDWKSVTNLSFSEDGVTHVNNGNETINFVYYPSDGYEVLPLDIETSFYGLGDKEATSIDRWQIALYDISKEHESSYVTVGVRSLTDITVKSEEVTRKITPDMYDEWSHCVLINYTPKLIKGQGIRLYIKTPLVIQSIVPHIADQGYTVGTNVRKSM